MEKRIRQIISLLDKAYPAAQIALKFKDPLQLLVSTILSAQCTDSRVNMVTERIFKKYKNRSGLCTGGYKNLPAGYKVHGFLP